MADHALTSKTAQLRAKWERLRFKVFGDKGNVGLLVLGRSFRP